MTKDNTVVDKDLVVDGPLSDNERLKGQSDYLRGGIAEDLKDRKPFLVSFEPKENFVEYVAYANYAIGLTKRFLLNQLFHTFS